MKSKVSILRVNPVLPTAKVASKKSKQVYETSENNGDLSSKFKDCLNEEIKTNRFKKS